MTEPAEPWERTLRLRILCTTDLHGHVWPFDYQTDRTAPGRGLAGIATLVTAARQDAPASLLLDCGDILQGTAMTDWAAARNVPDAVHPVIRAMNAMGYDAAALGNHDFNYGLDPLRRAIGKARFPFLCANLVTELGEGPTLDTHFAPPWCILRRRIADDRGQDHDIAIGVIATAPPQTAIWDAAVLRGDIAARDAVEVVAAHLPALRAAGADVVIALSHGGPGAPSAEDMAEDPSFAIAALPGVDAVLTGHSHRRLPGPDYDGLQGVDARAGRLAGKPAAMAGAFGSDLAVMDLTLGPRDTGGGTYGWRVADSRVTLHSAAAASPQADVLDLTRADHAATRAEMAKTVGHARTRLHAVLPMAVAAPAMTLLAQAQAATAARLVAGSTLDGLPILSAVAPFKAGGPAGPDGFIDIPAGPLRLRHLVELSPFPNRLCVLAITGADLRAWLERTVSAYNTVPQGCSDLPLLDPRAPSYTLDELHGVRYTIDLSRPPLFDTATGSRLGGGAGMGRIVGLTYAGRPVADSDRFAVATNSFRANGGGGFRMIPRHTPRLFSRGTLRDVLLDHLGGRGTIGDTGPAPWDFAPLGTSVIARTAPHVRCESHGGGAVRMEDAGRDAAGFRCIRLFV
ncbi:5'-nucleotidase C-terminal domain-containing protein [Meridianimarinicoccus sp. RP-17]|uniref:5'-nucleotidase C-terminal domain-containing protein n=1 Tax=Meridianimarinicoccus zhengii TaxID=2056810 RepID=UPI0013A6CC5E|nr:5'-nucleotidase C-terminal domain-containing protein [Phycocomes zhengii]